MARKLTVVVLLVALAVTFHFSEVRAAVREEEEEAVAAAGPLPHKAALQQTQEGVTEDELDEGLGGGLSRRSSTPASIARGPSVRDVLRKVAAPLAGSAAAYGVSYLTTPEFTEAQIADEEPVPLSQEVLSATGIASLAIALGLLGYGAYQAGKLGYKKYRSLRGKGAPKVNGIEAQAVREKVE